MPSRFAAFSTRPCSSCKTRSMCCFSSSSRVSRESRKGAPTLGMAVEVKIVEGDVFLVTQQHGAFDNVAQLTNVAGP